MGKIWIEWENNIKFIQNKMVRKESKYKKKEGSITVKKWEDKEAKKKGKCWKKCNSRCVN